MIGGSILLGPKPRKVIIRALRPLLPLGGKLGNATLELFNSNGTLIGRNANWRSDQQAAIIATRRAAREKTSKQRW